MQKGIIKAIVLSVIFFAAVAVFSIMTNQVNEDLTTEMAEASLPILTLYTDNIEINTLHGYTGEMDASYMRDSITPIPENRSLPMKIQTYQKVIDGISFEIRSLDASRLIANADVNEYTQEKGVIRANLEIQNLLEEGEEYLLTVCIKSGEEKIYYYTRIIEPVQCYVSECLTFVREFHNATFDRENSGSLSMYLERAIADNTTLQYTTLNSSLKQITWADFGGELLREAVPSIKEITPTYNVITLDYVMTRIGEGGISEYYNVEECYRVRYTKQRMYLLNFERTVNEIFRGENGTVTANVIGMGIRSSDVEFKASDMGNIVAFVQEGELWSYDQTQNTLVKVFSFRGYEGIDERENYGAHDIKIVNIDEAGSITYIVYGYMNRGIHEGKVGIAIYRYDSLANTNEEVLFIPSNQSYEVMKSDLGQLMYVNDGGIFFLMVGDAVYGVDLATFETEKVICGIEEGEFAVSESNRLFAWVAPDKELGSNTITIMDLMTEQKETVKGRESEYLKPLGFMEEDLIYGIAKKEDVQVDVTGNVMYPMNQINIAQIVSQNVEILKTYKKDGYYVSDIYIDGFTIYLNRVQYNGNTYVDANQDMIMNREGNTNELVTVESVQEGTKQTQLELVFKKSGGNGTPKLLTPKETILEEKREVALEEKQTMQQYYVYAKGKVLLSTDCVADAVKLANENMGVVVDGKQRYIWKRSRKTVQSAFKGMIVGDEDRNAGSIAQGINAMLERENVNISVSALLEQGETPKEILSNALKEAIVLDLSGCTIDEVLYYISNGAPVFALEDTNEAVLLIGYDASYVSIYDPVKNLTYRKNKEDADEMFAAAGSVFFTYLK